MDSLQIGESDGDEWEGMRFEKSGIHTKQRARACEPANVDTRVLF